MALDILNKFTTNLKNTLVEAINVSIRLKHPQVLPIHLLLSLSEQSGSIASEVLQHNKLTTNQLRAFLNQIHWKNQPRLYSLPQLSNDCIHMLEHAAIIAFDHKHKYVGTEHLLLSLIEVQDAQLVQVFKTNQVNVGAIQQQVVNVLNNTSHFPDVAAVFKPAQNQGEVTTAVKNTVTNETDATNDDQNNSTPALDFFSTDLTDPDIQASIDPVIGRAAEIDRLIHILSRRTKNNPLLLGEPGVGKTAIVEGLAKRIAQRQVPSILLDKKIYRLDLSLVVAGTMYRGEFEGRLKQIMDELADHPEIIVFIDEIHTIIGAGGAGGNAMDAANILKPGLARGEIRCIGATTVQEYQKYIESDAALERRFRPIYVEEPSMDETIQVLRGVKVSYEQFHHVQISDTAITAAVKLSVRYIQDKFLPDKAIDLLDEAAASYRVQQPLNPQEQQVVDLEEKLKQLQAKKLALVKNEHFELAVELKKEEQALRKDLDQLQREIQSIRKQVLGTITATDIAAVVSKITHVPLENLVTTEKDRLLNLQTILDEQVVGQDEATKAVAELVRRSRTGLTDPNKPIGSFMFLGPSGVGKTELAKTLARVVFGSEDNIIRIDMSEFSEGFSISKLIGAPAGYVGYKEGAKLTDQVKHKPYSLILFDEIEKAHRDVFNVLLQILDEGHLTDASGKKINFKNTIIIMTSNVGLKRFQEHAEIGFNSADNNHDRAQQTYATIQHQVLQELRDHFRPEFLNRIDKTIVFKPLTEISLIKIVQLQLNALFKRAKEQQLRFTVSKPVLRHLAKLGYTPEQGARAMHRTIQAEIETPLSEKLLRDEIQPGDKIHIGLKHDKLVFTKR